MDFTIVAHAVEVDHGIKRFSMRFIKRCAAPDRVRLSVELCEQMAQALDGLGLTTLPRRLPTSETEDVFVIQKSSPLGEAVIIAASVAMMEKMGTPVLPALFERFPEARRHLT
ncbi:hypothetical protein [Streptomyces odonnellii]|uniref:hypothetical protein n=1 Tax=Streptomyces odonnellii TaxID=1417980 RepID=UPI0006255A9D|nr:hypothetical protein [Streptomyces odonnellii]